MLDGLVPFLPLPPPSERPCRQQVFTKYVLCILTFYDFPLMDMTPQPAGILDRAIPDDAAGARQGCGRARRLVPAPLQGRVRVAHRARPGADPGAGRGGRAGDPGAARERGGGEEGEGGPLTLSG